jgi:hypothetical protein
MLETDFLTSNENDSVISDDFPILIIPSIISCIKATRPVLSSKLYMDQIDERYSSHRARLNSL